MRLLLSLFFALCLLGIVCGSPAVHLFVGGSGYFAISINNRYWFSSTTTKVFVNNQWYSSQDKSLAQTSYGLSTGSDVLGSYSIYTWQWSAGGVPFYTSIKTYPSRPNVLVFSQEFPNGANGTSVGSENSPLSSFPNLLLNETLGYLHYYDDMAGSHYQTGWFPTNYKGGIMGGPIAFFDTDLTTVVLSSFSYFLSAIANLDGGAYSVGVQGKVAKIPAKFKFEYILYAENGVNNAFMGWGDALLLRYNKKRVQPTASVVLSYLGYSTTGYYFYNPIDYNQSYGNYEDTLLQFNAYSKKLGIPYRYYLIDSWWYGEYTVYGGAWKWEDSPDLLQERFPHGLEYLHRQLGVPLAAHIGRWMSTSPYTKNPDYGFVVEKTYSIPTRVELYDYIFQNASVWGLNTLKQDHINEQILSMTATLSDVTTARDWLLSEGRGAARHGINIEYCMDWPSILLTSLEAAPTATHSRAGGDYVPKQADSQWKIGVTSIWLWAIGLYPDIDTFYTSTSEVTRNPVSAFYNYVEPYPLVHAIASSMSAGPISPSDGINGTDKALVMRMCAADGLLLKPDRPAVNIDSTWSRRAFNDGGPNGDVVTTYTHIGKYVWHYVFAAQLTSPYNFVTTDLLLSLNNSDAIAYLFSAKDGTIKPQGFSSATPIVIPAGTLANPYLYTIAPILENGWVYFGETDKFVSVSKQRTSALETTANSVTVEISGQSAESVTLSFVAPYTLDALTYKCSIGAAGKSKFTISLASGGRVETSCYAT